MKIEVTNTPPQWKEIKIISHTNLDRIEKELNSYLDKDWFLISNRVSIEGSYWMVVVGKLKEKSDENEY